MRRSIALVSALMFVSGCGGGGSGTVALPTAPPSPIPAQPPSPQSRPNVSIAMQVGESAETAARTIAAHRVTMAAGVRTPQYVATTTLGVQVIVYPHGSGTPLQTTVYDVSSGSNICSGTAPRTCTLALNLQPGSYDFAMTLYDAAPSSGAMPVGAKALSTGTLLNQTIRAYVVNSLAFIVDGIVSSISTPTFASVPADGSAHAIAVSFVAYDADGNPITGSQPFASPLSLTLAERGGSGHTYLLVNGANAGTSASITQPGESLAIHYDGGGSAGYTTQTSIMSAFAPTQTLRVSPMYLSTTTVAASDAGQLNNVTITEAGAPRTAYTVSSCPGFSFGTTNGSGGGGTVAVTSPPAIAGQTLLGTYSCGGPVTIVDAFGTAQSLAVSATIPTTTDCASAASSIYLGTKMGPQYVVGQGVRCPLSASASSITVFAPPNDGLHPASASDTISERNDDSPASVSAPTCANVVTTTSALVPGASLASPLSGSVVVASVPTTASTQTCSVQVSDGVASKPVSVTVEPSIQTFASGPLIESPPTCADVGFKATCVTTASEDIGANGGNGSTFSFRTTTNAIHIEATVAGNSGARTQTNSLSLYDANTGAQFPIASATNGATATVSETITLPDGPGTYGLTASAAASCLTSAGNTCDPAMQMSVTGSVVEAPSGTGTVTP